MLFSSRRKWEKILQWWESYSIKRLLVIAVMQLKQLAYNGTAIEIAKATIFNTYLLSTHTYLSNSALDFLFHFFSFTEQFRIERNHRKKSWRLEFSWDLNVCKKIYDGNFLLAKFPLCYLQTYVFYGAIFSRWSSFG